MTSQRQSPPYSGTAERESARQRDGRFGIQQRAEAPIGVGGVDLMAPPNPGAPGGEDPFLVEETQRRLRDCRESEMWHEALRRCDSDEAAAAMAVIGQVENGLDPHPESLATTEAAYAARLALMRADASSLPLPAQSRLHALQARVDAFASDLPTTSHADPAAALQAGELLLSDLRDQRARCRDEMDSHEDAAHLFQTLSRRAEESRSGRLSPASNYALDSLGSRLFSVARDHRQRAYDIEYAGAATERLIYAIEDRLTMLERSTR